MQRLRSNKPIIILLSLVLLGLVAAGIWVTSQAFRPVEARQDPTILTVQPDGSTPVSRRAAIAIQFDQHMDHSSVEAALNVQPAFDYGTEWESTGDGETLRLLPNGSLAWETAYTITVEAGAKNTEGRLLATARTVSFTTGAEVRVTNVSPGNGNNAVDPAEPITVQFDRPIVDAATATNNADLPQPIQVEPAVQGIGRWIAPDLYGFYPTVGFTAGTDYEVRIAPEIAPAMELPEAYEWQFVTSGPRLTSAYPYDGANEIERATAITLLFNQPMDRASVEQNFLLAPDGGTEKVAGQFIWEDDQTLVFQPNDTLNVATPYSVNVNAGARAQGGSRGLASPYRAVFTTIDFLAVESVQPAAGSAEVSTAFSDTVIAVQFNHPVVPLVGLAETAELPVPITISPRLAGEGEWVTTSLFIFRPNEALQPSTEYRVTVEQGLQDTVDSFLQEEYTWSFTTEFPRVVRVEPSNSRRFVAANGPIGLRFNQPMNTTSAEAGFDFTDSNGNAVAGRFAWQENNTLLQFFPTTELVREQSYTITLAEGVNGAGAGSTENAFNATVTVAPLPRVTDTTPTNGAEGVSVYDPIQITFNVPMNVEDVETLITINPTSTQVYTYYDNDALTLNISIAGPLEPSSDYTVTLSGELADESGQPLGNDVVLTFRTAPLPPNLNLITSGYNIGTYNPYTETVQVISHRNISAMNFTITRMPLTDLIPMLTSDGYLYFEAYEGDPAAIVAEWSEPVDVTENVGYLFQTRVPKEGDRLESGIYLLRVTTPEVNDFTGEPLESKVVMIYTPINLTMKRSPEQVLVWATDLQSGQPAANIALEIRNDDGEVITTGTSDENGLFQYEFTSQDIPGDPYSSMYAVAIGEPGTPIGIVASDWNAGIASYEFGITESLTPRQLYGTIYSERPIYRPGQTVFYKGILRQEDGSVMAMPTLSDAKLTISYQGEVLESQNITFSPFGTFHGQFVLDEEAPTGYYEIALQQEEIGQCYQEDYCYYESVYGSFQVAEYQRPEFEVSVRTESPAVVQGDDATATIAATYYFGGALSNAPYTYRILSSDYYFDLPGLEGYWSWYDSDDFFQLEESGSEVIQDGEGALGGNGQDTLSIDTDLRRGEEAQESQRYTIEADVRDVNDRTITGRTDLIVHAGEFYIGLNPQTVVDNTDQPFTITVATADSNGTLNGGREIALELYQREWYTVREESPNGGTLFTSAFSDTLVASQNAVTGEDGFTEVVFTPEVGGSYTLLATAQDERGNEIRSRTYFWVASDEFVVWERENNDRIELIADQATYNVGDTARILVPTPFEGMVALVTEEQTLINRVEVRTLEGTAEVLEIPITEAMIPNTVISVVAVTGINEETPLADFRVGQINLTVRPTEKILNVAVTPIGTTAENPPQPGDTVNYELTVTDSAGEPVEAELSLAVVDKAILALGGTLDQSLVDTFYAERPVAVRTASGFIVNVDRLSRDLAPETKGGGGPGLDTIFGMESVRSNFVDTAYWNATITTDANGKAQITFDLPDNLTTWVLTARAVTGESTLIGEEKGELLSTKPLLIRPTLPRFFVVGDSATLRVAVSNNTNAAIEGNLTFAVEGLTLNQGNGSQSVTIPAGGQEVVEFEVTVNEGESVTVVAGIEGGGLQDAVQLTIPVYHLATPEVVATGGVVRAGEGGAVETIRIPENARPTEGNLTIEVAPSLAGATESTLTYLESYPYDTAEWAMSTLLPNAATLSAIQSLGFEREDIEGKLAGNIQLATQRLITWQNVDGGWGWWRTDESNVWLSAYGLLSLHQAKATGESVPDERMARATRFLERWLSRTAEQSDDRTLDTRAFVLYVLSETGNPDVSRTVALFDQRSLLGIDGKSYLLLALDNAGDNQQAQVQTLASELTAAARLSATGAHWEESDLDLRAFDSSVRSTALVLQALVRVQPEHLLIPQTVRWLMHARESLGGWETPQESAWSVIALTDYMLASGELEGNFAYEVALNDEVILSEQASPNNITDPISLTLELADILTSGDNRLIVTRQPNEDAKGRLYYNAWLRYFIAFEKIEARFEGISVARQYEAVDSGTLQGTGQLIDSIAAGDVIQVRVRVSAPTDLTFFVLEDPIPAGFEVIDPALLTNSQATSGPGGVRVDESAFNPYWYADWSQSVIRDEKVVLFRDFLPKGTYEYTYLLRAIVPGTYNVMPSIGYEAYHAEVFGRSDSSVFEVTE